PRVMVVGGGVGGLATAVALHARGVPVGVLERSAAESGAGSGLTLWPNGVRALEAIGLGPAVREHSLPGDTAVIRTPSGRYPSRLDPGGALGDRGAVVAVHRAELTEVLRAALPAGTVRAGVTVTGMRRDGRGRPVVVTAAGEETADVVGVGGVRRRPATAHPAGGHAVPAGGEGGAVAPTRRRGAARDPAATDPAVPRPARHGPDPG
ncbi:hypothetical protein FNQ90_25260, partial [Streptomyces alkaliphilus]